MKKKPHKAIHPQQTPKSDENLAFNYTFQNCQKTYKAQFEEVLTLMNMIIQYVTGNYIEDDNVPEYAADWNQFIKHELFNNKEKLFEGNMRHPLGIAVS